jgi:hypothetical protein
MAPICLSFGANSSGKSSIGQFLMMLKQTVEIGRRSFTPEGKTRQFNSAPTRKWYFTATTKLNQAQNAHRQPNLSKRLLH